MRALPQKKALIFDMDGVLWDSGAIHHQAYVLALGPRGVRVPSYEPLAGLRTDEAMRLLLAQAGIQAGDGEIHRLTAAKRSHARELLQRTPPLMPRCREVLERLGRNHLLALASSASKDSVDLFLQASQTRALFKVIVCGEEVLAAKPAPDIYLTALQRMAVAPAEAYVIEDSRSGIDSAIAAGIAVIVYRTAGFAPADRQQIVAAIDSLDELLVL